MDLRGIRRFEFGALDGALDEDGEFMTLTIHDSEGQDHCFLMPTNGIPAILLNLLQVIGHLKVQENLTTGPHPNPTADSAAELAFLPYQAIGAGYIQTSGKAGLMITFGGGLQFGLMLDDDIAPKLSQSLEQAIREAKNPQDSKRLN
jgi:hypothetical protein